MQGDYGLFQCSQSCHNKTYDNKEIITEMIANTTDNRIPTSLIPVCPKCGKPLAARPLDESYGDDLFV